MSDKKERSTQEIQQEYQNLAFRAGNLQYDIVMRQSDLKVINDTMRDLSLEFNIAKAKEDAAKAEASKQEG